MGEHEHDWHERQQGAGRYCPSCDTFERFEQVTAPEALLRANAIAVLAWWDSYSQRGDGPLFAALRAALAQPAPAAPEAVCWFCKRTVVEALIAGYDSFYEQRLACLACNERMQGDWRPDQPAPAAPEDRVCGACARHRRHIECSMSGCDCYEHSHECDCPNQPAPAAPRLTGGGPVTAPTTRAGLALLDELAPITEHTVGRVNDIQWQVRDAFAKEIAAVEAEAADDARRDAAAPLDRDRLARALAGWMSRQAAGQVADAYEEDRP